MEINNIENNENSLSDEVKQTKTRKIMERRAPWRYREDGTYNNNPLSGTYFRDYYHDKLSIKKQCELCNRPVCLQQIKRHQKSSLCQKNRNKNI
jgi:hypothetical protein